MDILSPLAEARNVYSYSADGVKLRVVKKYNSNIMPSPIICLMDQGMSSGTTQITDYVGNKIFENNVLDRILVDGGYIKNGAYYFYETDHLGSNRLTVSQTGTASDRSDYYPYGMQMGHNDPNKGLALLTDGSAKTAFKFSGKELDVMHGLNLYDSQARWYDPCIPILPTPDPMAEKYYSISPYVYCGDNPMNRIDPTGMDWVYRIVDGVTESYYDRDVKSQEDVNKKYGDKSGVTHMSDGTTLTSYDKDGNVKSQYTFTNDSKENKYGTVTDMNGNKLDNTQITYGSNYTIFGTSDNSVNGETLHKNLMGTSYTGPDNPKDYLGFDSYQYQPRNASEYPSMQHDKEYDKLHASGLTGALFDIRTLDADMRLVQRNAKLRNDPSIPIKDRHRAANTAAVFGFISGFKINLLLLRTTP